MVEVSNMTEDDKGERKDFTIAEILPRDRESLPVGMLTALPGDTCTPSHLVFAGLRNLKQ